jgi:flagellar basal-body rod modification protein FlgD
MASIGTTYPSSSAAASSADNSSSSSSSAGDLGTQSAFLTLLVAQLQNQDPLQPMDGTTFVTQLAQFNDVEQNLGMKQDLDAISEKYLGVTTPPSAGGSTNSNATPQTN